MEIRFGTQVCAYETWTKTEYLQASCTKAISFLLLQFQVAFIFRTFGGSFLLNMRKITFLWKCSKTLKFYVFNSTLNEYTLVTAEREIKTAGFSLSGISCISRRILHKPLPEPQFSYLQDEWEIRIMIFFLIGWLWGLSKTIHDIKQCLRWSECSRNIITTTVTVLDHSVSQWANFQAKQKDSGRLIHGRGDLMTFWSF